MGGLRLGDPGWRLRRQAELELLQQELMIFFGLSNASSIAAQCPDRYRS